MQVLSDVNLLQVLQLESLSVLFPHILALCKAVKVENQVHEFFVGLIIVERYDRNSVIQLVAEGIDSIVDYDEVFQITIRDNPQILNIYTLFSPDTVVSVKSVLNKLIGRVQNIENHICISTVTGSEYDHLIALVCLLQAFDSIWSNVNSCFNCFSIRESD